MDQVPTFQIKVLRFIRKFGDSERLAVSGQGNIGGFSI
jgi:hypothetical protein